MQPDAVTVSAIDAAPVTTRHTRFTRRRGVPPSCIVLTRFRLVYQLRKLLEGLQRCHRVDVQPAQSLDHRVRYAEEPELL